MIYTGCAFVFTPFVEIEQLQNLNTFTLICFYYCCLNTLIGYGAYAEALNHWDVAKVRCCHYLWYLCSLFYLLTSIKFNIPTVFFSLN